MRSAVSVCGAAPARSISSLGEHQTRGLARSERGATGPTTGSAVGPSAAIRCRTGCWDPIAASARLLSTPSPFMCKFSRQESASPGRPTRCSKPSCRRSFTGPLGDSWYARDRASSMRRVRSRRPCPLRLRARSGSSGRLTSAQRPLAGAPERPHSGRGAASHALLRGLRQPGARCRRTFTVSRSDE